MAKIEMDLSEFKQMEKNVTLLEKAIEDNEKAQEEIARLKEEKIKALQDNSQVVTVITTSRKENHVYQKRSNNEILERLQKASYDQLTSNIGGLIEHFFQMSDIHHPDTTYTTTKGLNEVKKDLKAIVTKELGEEFERTKEQIIVFNEKFNNMNSELFKVKEERNSIKKENKQLIKSLDDLKVENKKINTDIDNIKEELDKPYSIFDIFKKINTLKNLV